jgi:hypothetical protein
MNLLMDAARKRMVVPKGSRNGEAHERLAHIPETSLPIQGESNIPFVTKEIFRQSHGQENCDTKVRSGN